MIDSKTKPKYLLNKLGNHHINENYYQNDKKSKLNKEKSNILIYEISSRHHHHHHHNQNSSNINKKIPVVLKEKVKSNKSKKLKMKNKLLIDLLKSNNINLGFVIRLIFTFL